MSAIDKGLQMSFLRQPEKAHRWLARQGPAVTGGTSGTIEDAPQVGHTEDISAPDDKTMNLLNRSSKLTAETEILAVHRTITTAAELQITLMMTLLARGG